MGLFKSAAAVAAMNFRSWLKDIRVRFIILVIGYLLYIYVTPFASFGLAAGEKCSIWFLPNLFIGGGISVGTPKVVFHIGMLLLLCDAPFLSPVSPYMILRSRRDAWWIGECLYIIGAAFLYALFIMLLSMVVLLPVAAFGNEWGGVLESIVFKKTVPEEAAYAASQMKFGLSGDMIRYLYPQGACLYTFAAIWCSFSFLGLLVYLVSLMKRSVLAGMSAAALFILWDPFVIWIATEPSPLYWMMLFSPVTWTSLNTMDVVSRFNIMSMPLALGLYAVLIVILIVLIAGCSRKTMIELR